MSFYHDTILQEDSFSDKLKSFGKKVGEKTKEYGKELIGTQSKEYREARAAYDRQADKYKKAIKACKERNDAEGVEYYKTKLDDARVEFKDLTQKLLADDSKHESAFI